MTLAMLTDLLEFHAFCLTATGTRLDQFAAALDRTITPGCVVLDLGAGFGILSFLACRRGARRVYAVEVTESAEFGRHLAASLGLADQVTFLRGTSFTTDLPEPVDVIVADVHAPFGLQEGGLSALRDAAGRWLKPGGTVIPDALEWFVAPVEAPDSYRHRVDVWRQSPQGLSLETIRAAAVNLPYPARFTPDHLLGPMTSLARAAVVSADAPSMSGRVSATVERAGTLHGVCGAMISTLAPGIVLSNVPGATETTNFACAFFPIETPLPVHAGDRVDIDIAVFDGLEARWSVAVTEGATGTTRRPSQHATLQAMPALAASLRRQAPGYRPRLTPAGKLAVALASRFDGTQTVAELDAWLASQIPGGPGAASRRSHLLKATIEQFG
jgi:16S rRNA G966 N2-methylase RsmD